MTETALDIATQLVIQFEGFRAAPYTDTAGIWTIGYGTTHIKGQPVTSATSRVTPITASRLMSDELSLICNEVASRCPVGASPQQIAACTSFAYNEGLSAFKGSTLLFLWKEDDVKGASEQFMEWVYDHDPKTHQLVEVGGLRNRRLIEQAMFLSDISKVSVVS